MTNSDVLPVRKVRPNRRSVTGFYASRTGAKLAYESELERDAYMLLDFSPSVRGIEPQSMRIDAHVPDCRIDTIAKPHVADIKYEKELVQSWEESSGKFSETHRYCMKNGLQYGFITDNSIEGFADRLNALKQILYKGRGQPSGRENDLLDLIKQKGTITIRDLAEAWKVPLDYPSKLVDICKLIMSGGAVLSAALSTLHECTISAKYDGYTAPSPSFIVPYSKFLLRLEGHPLHQAKGCMVKYEGEQLMIGKHTYQIIEKKIPSDATLQNIATGELYCHINLNSLNSSQESEPNSVETDDSSGGGYFVWLSTQHPDLYEGFNRRKSIILPLLQLRDRSNNDVKEVAQRAGVSDRTIRRWLNSYERDGPPGLVSREYRRGPKKPIVDRRVEALVRQIIDEEYLTKQRKRPSEIFRTVKSECAANSIKCPSLMYVYRQISKISQQIITSKRLGWKAYDEMYGLCGGEFRDKLYPLHTIQIDHSQLDIRLIDELTREVVARPWLTLAVDVYSRCVWAYHLGLRQPDDDTVGLTIVMGAHKKDRYIEMFNLSSEWPVYGVPFQIHTDNGKDFRSKLLDAGCVAHAISIMRRPVKKARYGGYIERLFRTIETELIENLPGKTFSNTVERKLGDYDPDKEALLTISDLERHLVQFIADQYHNQVHTELGMAPIEKWKAGLKEMSVQPREPENIESFRLDFLSFPDPDGMRTIQKDGIHFNDITFYAPELELLPRYKPGGRTPEKYLVRYDPFDMRYLYILDGREGGHSYHTLRAKGLLKKVTLREIEATRKEKRTEGNQKPSVATVTEAILRRREQNKALALDNKKICKQVAAAARDEVVHDRFVKAQDEEEPQTIEDYEPRYNELMKKIRLPSSDTEVI